MKTMELSNIDTHKHGKVDEVHGTINQVVYRLATLNPLWTFRVKDVNTNFQGVKSAMGFDVFEQGEKLGTIARTYRGGTNVIGICNDRIAKGRSRGDTYHTEDAEKAILKAKKMFYRLKPDERITQATKSAHDAINSQIWNRERAKAQEEQTIRKAALEYFSGPGLAHFLEYIGTQPPSISTPILKAVEKTEEVRGEMLTIETIRQRFEKEEVALVIKDSGKYLVKVRDNVQLYDDNTLPHEMRSKLGMLKLVEAETFLSNVGCRVNDEVFVLVLDEQT
jgi:hypothetical protein